MGAAGGMGGLGRAPSTGPAAFRLCTRSPGLAPDQARAEPGADPSVRTGPVPLPAREVDTLEGRDRGPGPDSVFVDIDAPDYDPAGPGASATGGDGKHCAASAPMAA